MLIFSFSLHPAGSSQDRRQRAHKPEGSRSGWISSTVQDQKTHATHQTHESLLRETGGHGTVIVQLSSHWLIVNTQDDIAGLCPEPVVKIGGHRAIAELDLSKNFQNMQIFLFSLPSLWVFSCALYHLLMLRFICNDMNAPKHFICCPILEILPAMKRKACYSE